MYNRGGGRSGSQAHLVDKGFNMREGWREGGAEKRGQGWR